MQTTVTGICPDLATADKAVAQLVSAGFPREDLSVILRSTPHHEELVRQETDDTIHGALIGAVGGGVLASLAFALTAITGVGFLVAGPLLAALGAGGVGAIGGGLVGVLTGHGVSSQMAQAYEAAIEKGRVIVAVHTAHRRVREAKKTLRDSGAADLSDSVRPARDSGADEQGA